MIQVKKSQLRTLARVRGDAAILAAAQGNKAESIDEKEVQQIQDLYKDVL